MMSFLTQGGTAGAILILALVIAIGLWLGRFKVWGISFGMVWILFVGIILSHFGLRINPTMLSFIKDFGLILFVFAIGEEYDFNAHIDPSAYIIASAGTILVMVITSIVLAQSLRKIDMVASLKANE